MPSYRLIDVELPDFGVPRTMPALGGDLFAARVAALAAARRAAGLDALVVYADREHAANMAYLTDFDPRFEEALLVLAPDATPTILTGPENLGRARTCAIGVEERLYPPFGLLGQDRGLTPSLEEVLRNAGIGPGDRVGTIGWKYFGPSEAAKPDNWLEIPSYIADTLRRIVGGDGRVVNANALMMHPTAGLRATAEIAQIARFEFGAVMASEAVKALIAGIRPGMTELEASRLMRLPGLPLSCHVMLSGGERLVGLNSPSDGELQVGDPVTTAVGFAGGLTSRVGWIAEDRSGLPTGAQDYVERLAGPYFLCAAEWYEAIGIGVTGGSLDALVRRHLDGSFFNLGLNPGHLIAADEWMNTPIYPGSQERLASGQVIQCDIIPAVGPPYHSANIEDGVALLDDAGRERLQADYPEAWDRIQARREFMRDDLGIRLKPEVLPLSNMAGALPPFWLKPGRILARV